MAIAVQDTFTDDNATPLDEHVGETGATWTKLTGSVDDTIEGNRLQHSNPGYSEQFTYASGVPSSAEYDIEFTYQRSGYGDDTGHGVCGRFNIANEDCYLVCYETYSAFRRWNLYKRESGSWTSLGTYSHSPTDATDYEIKLEIRDAAKKVYIDGVERISSNDNSVTAAGRVAIRSFGTIGGSGASQYTDGLVVTPVATGNRRRRLLLGT